MNDTIQALYNVFSRYHGNPKMAGSPLYEDLNTWNHRLFAKPLSVLSADDLGLYVGKAMSTWGEVTDFKHFLPRLCELVACYDSPHSIITFFEKLVYAHWTSWPVEEVVTVQRFLTSLFEELVSDDGDLAAYHFESYFNAIIEIHPTPESLLVYWGNAEGKVAYKHLAGYIVSQSRWIFASNVMSESYERIRRWVLCHDMRERLEVAYFRYIDTDVADDVSHAEQLVMWALRDRR